MSEDLTLSDKRSIPHWLQDHDRDILALKGKQEDNEKADTAVEKRVAQLEFKMKVIWVIGGGSWTMFMALFGWLLSKI